MDGTFSRIDEITMRVTLEDIAKVKAGYPFRGGLPMDENGDMRILQIRDLRGKAVITPQSLPRIETGGNTHILLLDNNDLVMAARGDYYNTVRFADDGTDNYPVVPSSQLLIMRPNKRQVLPEYLCWYLNQDATLNYLKSEVRGTNMPFISRESLTKLQVRLPSITTQQKIVDVLRLWEQEKQLTEQLMQNRETMLKGVFQKLMEQ